MRLTHYDEIRLIRNPKAWIFMWNDKELLQGFDIEMLKQVKPEYY